MLQMMPLLYPRPGKLRQAEWIEFNLENAVLTTPAIRAEKRHLEKKPLPALAVGVLFDLKRGTRNRRSVFPSTQSAERSMSENTRNLVILNMSATELQKKLCCRVKNWGNHFFQCRI